MAPENPSPLRRLDFCKSLFYNLISRRVPILPYVPETRQLPARVLPVNTAWKGIESILGDLIQRFNVGRRRCLEFGVEFGYSTAALSCFFDDVTGVDRFTGDKHTVNQDDIFLETSERLSRFANIRLVRSDYRPWIARDDSRYDLIHIDIVHTYTDTFTCGLWSARHAPCVLFHDTISYPAVRRAVLAIAGITGKHFYHFEESNGLG
ncbi:MAG: class I SAM-dependent methyltransferase, partial [Acidobacteria bacterium]|nr:class I SAM-dependent methyltransferase [Acidobacteriota bacterium]